MPKLIFVLIDGTGNKPGQTDNETPGHETVVESNVLRLWKSLTNSEEISKPGQLTGPDILRYYGIVGNVFHQGMEGTAIYFNGVGTQGSWLQEKADGMFGTGTSVRIRDAYRFIAEQYDPEDKICLFGFSRGAFAARSLAGFIEHVGIPSSRRVVPEHELGKMYESYRRNTRYDGKLAKLLSPANVYFIGIWDTVGSLAFEDGLNSFHKLSPPNVFHVRHALALDETRPHFAPTYWESEAKASALEYWFAGAHSNIGGGYRNPGLSNIAYIWMLRELTEILEIDKSKEKDLLESDNVVEPEDIAQEIESLMSALKPENSRNINLIIKDKDSEPEAITQIESLLDRLELKGSSGFDFVKNDPAHDSESAAIDIPTEIRISHTEFYPKIVRLVVKPKNREIKKDQYFHPSVFECMKITNGRYIPNALYEGGKITLERAKTLVRSAHDWPLDEN